MAETACPNPILVSPTVHLWLFTTIKEVKSLSLTRIPYFHHVLAHLDVVLLAQYTLCGRERHNDQSKVAI